MFVLFVTVIVVVDAAVAVLVLVLVLVLVPVLLFEGTSLTFLREICQRYATEYRNVIVYE